MSKRTVNPWTWQDKFGFVQANDIQDAKKMVFCAGIVSTDNDGKLLHPGNMEKQINRIIDNLETVLNQADANLSDIVRITYYTTDVPAFVESVKTLTGKLEKGNCKPATSLIGVASLFHPDCIVEFEATAVL